MHWKTWSAYLGNSSNQFRGSSSTSARRLFGVPAERSRNLDVLSDPASVSNVDSTWTHYGFLITCEGCATDYSPFLSLGRDFWACAAPPSRASLVWSSSSAPSMCDLCTVTLFYIEHTKTTFNLSFSWRLNLLKMTFYLTEEEMLIRAFVLFKSETHVHHVSPSEVII